jgi:hypothetical protein
MSQLYGSCVGCRYIAAGGEDDLVAVYGVQERYPVAHCLGHTSWVSRVQWDPWMQLEGGAAASSTEGSSSQPAPVSGSPSAAAALAAASSMSPAASGGGLPGPGAQGNGLPLGDGTRVYRIASVGQDTAMCLWDVQVSSSSGESELNATPIVTGVNMR